MSSRLRLLPSESLVRTSAIDHADWNYRPLLRFIQRRRFYLALALLGDTRYHRLIEIGYGSGVFMPELASHCDELYGIDVHQKTDEVQASLAQNRVEARLFHGTATSLPFKDHHFDVAVCISALEFVDDVGRACVEIGRVLSPQGVLVVVTPGHSAVLDFGLKVFTGESAQQDFADRRQKALSALQENFDRVALRGFPPVFPRFLRLYHALKLKPRK